MSLKQKRILWPLFVFIAVLACVLAYAKTTGTSDIKNAAATPGQINPASVEAQRQYVRRGRLAPQLRWNLEALGDRLEQSGKERLVLTGTASQPDRIQPSVFNFIWELPGRARLTIQDLSGPRTLVFNGESVQVTGQVEDSDRMLLETLIYDSPERCFIAVQQNPQG